MIYIDNCVVFEGFYLKINKKKKKNPFAPLKARAEHLHIHSLPAHVIFPDIFHEIE